MISGQGGFDPLTKTITVFNFQQIVLEVFNYTIIRYCKVDRCVLGTHTANFWEKEAAAERQEVNKRFWCVFCLDLHHNEDFSYLAEFS